MEHIKQVFARSKEQGRAALVGFMTAGFPTIEETADVLLGMEAGGVDVIELGIPYSDPVADGPTIQQANIVAMNNGITTAGALDIVRTARRRGLQTPVLLMGYFNPILQYGEEKMVKDAREAGASGFIVVDLPYDEAGGYKRICRNNGLSFIPLVTPATSDQRMKILCSDADSFIYVVSRMGTTGASSSLGTGIEDLLKRVHDFSGNAPAALGFGVSTREHFLAVSKLTEGVVMGSKLIDTVGLAPAGTAGQAIEEFCTSITQRTVKRDAENTTREFVVPELPALPNTQTTKVTEENGNISYLLPSRFGEFGGQYVSEAMIGCLAELEEGFSQARDDPTFWEEFRSYYPYISRPSSLHFADRLTKHSGGANIYLKREDLNHTGSHKINNALGQILLARRLGKAKIIAETGAGQHGVATATMCAKFGMQCIIYMGAEDVQRQALNVFRIKLLGATVIPVEAGSRTLRDAVNEALRAWVANIHDSHYLIGSAIGPHPFPTIVRSFQSIIGEETKEQMQALTGRLPDAVVACVGGGSNASGMFYPFAEDPSVKLLGAEAAGDGVETGRHSATLSSGTKGVLHGVHSYILQDKEGQCLETHSISAGLDYPGVGPELSSWKDKSRAEFTAVTDAQALEGLKVLSQQEGILPALESAHAVYAAIQLAKTMREDQNIVINLSGRGDKDVQSVADALPRLGPSIGWDLRFE